MGRAYSLDLREKVMSFIASGGSKKEASKVFSIGEDTVYRWIRRLKQGDLRAKKRHTFPHKVDPQALADYVDKNPDHTLMEMGAFFGLANQTMSTTLKYHSKKKTTLYKERCEEKRTEFNKKLGVIDPTSLVYIDEAGVDNRLFREYARALKGKKVFANIPGKKRERVSVMGGLRDKKFIAPFTFKGGCNANVFNVWLEKILLPTLDKGTTIVMDNASFHKSARTKELIEASGCFLLFLPPYSPDMNPIEHWWHKIKSILRPIIQETYENLQEIIGNCLLTC
jgi:transposase